MKDVVLEIVYGFMLLSPFLMFPLFSCVCVFVFVLLKGGERERERTGEDREPVSIGGD